jgi:uncharacterized phage protein (TIGR02220 family)
MDDEKKETSEKDNILINLDDYQAVRNFSNEDAGKLFHTICRDSLGEEIGDLEDKIQVAFNFFKNRLEKNRKNWEKTRKARIESGKLGGLAKQANANFAKQNEQTVANVAVSDNVNVSDSVSVSVNDIKKKASPSEEVIIILEDLNKRTKSKKGFSPSTQCNQDLIRARMSEGFTVENFITVNEKKVKQWLHDPEMAQYLRPATLYSNKFEGYLNQIEVKDVKQVKPKYPTADERRRENNKKVFEQSIKEIEDAHRTGTADNRGRVVADETKSNHGFFAQLHRELPQGDDG